MGEYPLQLLKDGKDLSDWVFVANPAEEKAAREAGYLFYGEEKSAEADPPKSRGRPPLRRD